MIKAIIFDFFGVIIGDGFDATYRGAGGDPAKDRKFIENTLELTNRGKISHVEFGNRIANKLGISLENLRKSVAQSEVLNTELINYIEKLHKKYKMAILSNANIGSVNRRVDKQILNRCFDEIVISAEVGVIKPQMEIYTLTAKKLGVRPEECLFVDDRRGYVRGAEAADMQAILFRNTSQCIEDIEAILT